MAGYDISVSRDLLPELLGSQDGLAKLVESVLNQILEAQVSESLGADWASDAASATDAGWQFLD
jgi:putative transposase